MNGVYALHMVLIFTHCKITSIVKDSVILRLRPNPCLPHLHFFGSMAIKKLVHLSEMSKSDDEKELKMPWNTCRSGDFQFR